MPISCRWERYVPPVQISLFGNRTGASSVASRTISQSRGSISRNCGATASHERSTPTAPACLASTSAVMTVSSPRRIPARSRPSPSMYVTSAQLSAVIWVAAPLAAHDERPLRPLCIQADPAGSRRIDRGTCWLPGLLSLAGWGAGLGWTGLGSDHCIQSRTILASRGLHPNSIDACGMIQRACWQLLGQRAIVYRELGLLNPLTG